MYNDIYSYDIKNLRSVITGSPDQARNGWRPVNPGGLDISDINSIVITGLGGSAISGDVLRNFLQGELKVPLIVNRTYQMPSFAGRNTLVIASSYSGNTEETISALKDAVSRGCRIVAITTGGEVERIASENGIPVVKLQSGFQPRYALYNSFFTLLRVMQDAGFISSQEQTVGSIISSLERLAIEWGSETGEAYRFAEQLAGYVPVIYSVTDMNDSAGRRFKGQLNENSKVHAWNAEYPEMNHNEIVGWESFRQSGVNYKIVMLYDDEFHPRVKKRIDVIKELLGGENVVILTFKGSAPSFRERLIETHYFCDWVSYYLALLNQKDPGEIDFIHYLKKRMSEDD